METYIHVPKFVFDNPVKDNRDMPLYTYDVVLVSGAISKRLNNAMELSIGLTGQFGGKTLQIHHYNARVLEVLKQLGVEEKTA